MTKESSVLQVRSGMTHDMAWDEMSIEATERPSSPTSRLFGLVFGLVFIVASTFLAFMLHGSGPLWVLLILWFGLSSIGLALALSNLSPNQSLNFVSFNSETRTLSWGKRAQDNTRKIKGEMLLTDVVELTLGSGLFVARAPGDVTALYVKGKGAPHNGCLTAGASGDLEWVELHAKRLIRSAA